MAALGTLSAGVAHEINNPLTYVLLNLEHVLRRMRAATAANDPVQELAGGGDGGLDGMSRALEHAVEGANRIRRVVCDLLTFAGGNVERRGVVDVRGILESATQLAWHEIRHRARLTRSFADVPMVEANEARLGQVFLNLLINAAHAIPDGQADRHEVHVSTRTDQGGNAVVEVSDTGSGIAQELLPCIFEPFFTTKGPGAAGLGLAISYGYVKSMGGDITVASCAARGTTFRVVLHPAEGFRAAPASSQRVPFAPSRKRVLLIDDEHLVGAAVARALSADHAVDFVTDAQEALARIGAGEPYDVILCDLLMPVMTGMDLHAEVMRLDPCLARRFVFMTGGAFTPRGRAFLETVANPCLEKPIDIGRLRRVVSRVRDSYGIADSGHYLRPSSG